MTSIARPHTWSAEDVKETVDDAVETFKVLGGGAFTDRVTEPREWPADYSCFLLDMDGE